MKLDLLFNWWIKNYFLDPLCALTALVGFIIFISKVPKKNELYIFSYYFIAYVFLKLVFFVDITFSKTPFYLAGIRITNFFDYIFTLFEFLIFFLFFKKILCNNSHKKVLTIICYLFMLIGCSLVLYDIYTFGRFRLASAYFLFNMQAISLLIPCAFYYLEIFKLRPTLDLLHEPSFWVVTGLSFFIISTLPFSLLLSSFLKAHPSLNDNLFDIFYVFYILLFAMIIKAYLCKQVTRK
jgi:hypothetical protein